MSYDFAKFVIYLSYEIEGSPDRWWVTTSRKTSHKISTNIEGSPDRWWVTTPVFSRTNIGSYIEGSPDRWWVTTSRTTIGSYMKTLKGHQIVGELRPVYNLCLVEPPLDWRVTRSLVSYDNCLSFDIKEPTIEGSPDRWWVTTSSVCNVMRWFKLKGHQIVGELRRYSRYPKASDEIEGSPDRWWVTTSKR